MELQLDESGEVQVKCGLKVYHRVFSLVAFEILYPEWGCPSKAEFSLDTRDKTRVPLLFIIIIP